MDKIQPIHAVRHALPAFGQTKIQMTREVGHQAKFGVDDENGYHAKGHRFNRLA